MRATSFKRKMIRLITRLWSCREEEFYVDLAKVRPPKSIHCCWVAYLPNFYLGVICRPVYFLPLMGCHVEQLGMAQPSASRRIEDCQLTRGVCSRLVNHRLCSILLPKRQLCKTTATMCGCGTPQGKSASACRMIRHAGYTNIRV